MPMGSNPRTKRQHVKRSLDIVGNRYGMLLVVERMPDAVNSHAVWRCQCDCGNECTKTTQQLTRPLNPSCGCRARYKPKSTANPPHVDKEQQEQMDAIMNAAFAPRK